MAFRATQQFQIDAVELILPAPEPTSFKRRVVPIQSEAASSSGGTFVDDKGTTRYEVSFSVSLTDAEAAALAAFFRDTAQGALNPFTWIDHESKTWNTVRFAPEPLDLSRTPGLRHRVTLRLITQQLFGV
jgi:hypothetical protein